MALKNDFYVTNNGFDVESIKEGELVNVPRRAAATLIKSGSARLATEQEETVHLMKQSASDIFNEMFTNIARGADA